MNLIYLFRRLVFAQVLLGIVAFCMAEQNPGMLLIAGAMAAMSWYLTEGPTGRPLPKWLINLGSLAAVGWLVLDLFYQEGDVILAMGHFTMWLQVLLLYAHKSNREYAQLLMLSLLQMVGASVLSVSIVYGALLLGYCVLALFTVLVFHLKTTSDLVMERNQYAAPLGMRVPRPKPVVGRGHRWQFRATALIIGLLCGATAVGVFIVLPRTSRYDSRAVTPIVRKQMGFSSEVRLDSGAPLGGSRQAVLSLAVWRDGVNIGSDESSYLLRGAALDHYLPQNRIWSRSPSASGLDQTIELPDAGRVLAELGDDVPVLDAKITLRNAAERTLFTLHPVTFISSMSLDAVEFNPQDQQLEALDHSPSAIVYEIQTPVTPPPGLFERYDQKRSELLPGVVMEAGASRDYARDWRVGRAAIQTRALEIIQAAGFERDPEAAEHPQDAALAAALADHLRREFTYALQNPPASQDDPIVSFLFKHRQGHCELFASALAALCRSIGIPARVITGYRASEYNKIGGYYVVRQTNAHAWTEVWCGDGGWRTFDATPPAEVAAEHFVERTWFTGVRELYEHIEFMWISSIIAYDKETREAVIEEIKGQVHHAATGEQSWIGRRVAAIRQFFQDWEFDKLSYILVSVISLFIVIGIASLVRTLVVRRQRLIALQLTKLPRSQRRGLARRLRFYLEMLETLERHGYHRPLWQSPASFAEQLASRDPMRFDPVVALTDHFYEIRFGYRPLDEHRQRLIKAHQTHLEHSLIEQR